MHKMFDAAGEEKTGGENLVSRAAQGRFDAARSVFDAFGDANFVAAEVVRITENVNITVVEFC